VRKRDVSVQSDRFNVYELLRWQLQWLCGRCRHLWSVWFLLNLLQHSGCVNH
jgi:hypothetical protein